MAANYEIHPVDAGDAAFPKGGETFRPTMEMGSRKEKELAIIKQE